MTLAAVLGQLLLLFCAFVNGQTTDEYTTRGCLDYCGQSCPSSCEEAEDEYAVCRCDSECEWYGDCCSPPSGRLNCTGGEQRAQPLAGLQCRSIHLDSRTQPGRMEAFWMVSACPEDWPANQDDEVLREVDEKCSNGSDTLPPVTDLDGGVVYKNEYCAVCHQVANIQPWGYRFGCSSVINDVEGNIRPLIMIEETCIACGFYVPRTSPPPRPCLHDSLVVDQCLIREVLEERTGLRWEEEVYRDIVTQCQTGPVRPVAAKNLCNEPPTYRNQYCAICNAENATSVVCANPYNSTSDLDYCLLAASDPYRRDKLEDDGSRFATTPEPDTTSAPDPQTSGNGETHDYYNDDNSGNNEIYDNSTFDLPNTTDAPTTADTYPFHTSTSFTLFFDVTGDFGVISLFEDYYIVTTSCSRGQVFDPINQACRTTACPEGFAFLRGSCTIVQNIPLAETYNSSDDSVVVCNEGLIALHKSEFELVDNDTLLFRNDTFEIVAYNGSSPIICSNFTQNGTTQRNMTTFYYSYPPTLSVLTYVCCSLSIVGCAAVLLTYSLFRELRTLPGQILMNLASTILATCLFLLVGIPIAVLAQRDELCEATAMLLHWLMLSQFSWMSIMSFEILRTLHRASRLLPVEDKSTENKLFLLYLLIGWGIPFSFRLFLF